MQPEIISLPSGATVIYTPADMEGYGVAFNVLAGHRNGTDVRMGLAHFVEHIAAAGASDVFARHEFMSTYRDQYGVMPNAQTSTQTSAYLVGSLPFNFYGFSADELHDGTLKAVQHLTSLQMDEATITSEAARINKEIIKGFSEPWFQTHQRNQPLTAQMYPNHVMACAAGVIGTPEEPLSTTPDELRAFYNEYYLDPRRWCISIIGPQRPDDLIAAISQHFDPLTPPADAPSVQHHYQMVMQGGSTYPEPLDPNGYLATVYLPYPPAIATDHNVSAAGYVFEQILDKYIANDALSGQSGYGMGFGSDHGDMNHFTLRVNYQTHDHAIQQISRCLLEIKRIADHLDPTELDEVKSAYKRRTLFHIPAPYGQASDASREHMRGLPYLSHTLKQRNVAAVTAEDVSAIARYILSGEVGLFNAAAPEERLDLEELRALVKTPLSEPVRPATKDMHVMRRWDDKPILQPGFADNGLVWG